MGRFKLMLCNISMEVFSLYYETPIVLDKGVALDDVVLSVLKCETVTVRISLIIDRSAC